MQTLAQMQYDIEMLKTRVDNMIRPATVTYVYRKKGEDGIETDRDDGKHIGFVDVVSGEIKLERIPVYQQHNESDTTLWLPTEGEDGTIFSAGGDLANAFFTCAIPTKKQNIPAPEGPATKTIKTDYRGGNKEELVLDVNQYTHEITDGDEAFRKVKLGDSTILFDKDKIEIKRKTFKIEINDDKIEVERGSHKIELTDSKILLQSNTEIEQRISTTNYKELTNILANIIGAHFFPSGLTTLTCAVGAVMFPPAPSPSGPPALPAGSDPSGSGGNRKATKLPAQQIDDVAVRPGSNLNQTWATESMSLIVVTPIPVVTPAGPGTIAAGTYPIQLTGNPATPVTGKLNLTFPAKGL